MSGRWIDDKTYWEDPKKVGQTETMDEFDIGDQVLKHTGDYRIPGEIRSKFQLYDGGPVRYVVRHEAVGGGHFCHIYAPANLRRQSSGDGKQGRFL